MHLTSFLSIPWLQWEVLFVPALLVYFLLVHLLRGRRAKSLERKFSPAGRASFCHMTTTDAQAILKDLTELEFPKLFGFSIIFALFKVGNPDSLLRNKKGPQTRPTTAYHCAIDIRNTERVLPSRLYWTACKCRNGIETDCRHRRSAARVRNKRTNIRESSSSHSPHELPARRLHQGWKDYE